MGKRQIGELTPHELVITILVSQVAIIPLQDNAMPLSNMFVPILVFISFEIIASVISMKSISFRNIIQGKPIFVIKDGRLDEKQMKRLRLTVDDLIDALRQKDIFDISTVRDAVIETNGTVSVLQYAESTPVTPKEMNIEVSSDSTPVPIVIDGKPVTEYFGERKIKNSEINLIVKSKNEDLSKIMLLTIDDDGKVYLIPKRSEIK
ncbi:MAG: DUF421 domain-containing protein [Clostridiales bacterium]|nr:DUF421 domain-containing protein [Clostridiales bacterium]